MNSSKTLAYSLTMLFLSLPSLTLAQSATPPATPASGDDAIYCRPPQQRTDSRMMGPKVCMPLGKWKELRAKGLDVSADGQSVQQMGIGAGFTGTPYDLRPQP